jgi:hypothetical protein
MPIRVNIDSQANLVTLTCSELLTYHDFATAFEERVSHPHYKPNMDILYDLRTAAIDMTLQELKQAVVLFKTRQAERGTDFRLAVVTATVSTYGFVNLYQAQAEELPEEIRIFDNLTAARQWLGIED